MDAEKEILQNALDAACAILEEALKEKAAADAREAPLREALGWYADEENWYHYGHPPSVAELDGGDKARAALSSSGSDLLERMKQLEQERDRTEHEWFEYFKKAVLPDAMRDAQENIDRLQQEARHPEGRARPDKVLA